MRPARQQIKGLLTRELNQEAYDESTLRLVEDLIGFLLRDDIAVRLYVGYDPTKPALSVPARQVLSALWRA